MNAHTPKRRNRRYATEAKIRTLAPMLVQVARECGLDVGGIEISPDGSIRVVESRTAPPVAPLNDFDRFESEL